MLVLYLCMCICHFFQSKSVNVWADGRIPLSEGPIVTHIGIVMLLFFHVMSLRVSQFLKETITGSILHIFLRRQRAPLKRARRSG